MQYYLCLLCLYHVWSLSCLIHVCHQWGFMKTNVFLFCCKILDYTEQKYFVNFKTNDQRSNYHQLHRSFLKCWIRFPAHPLCQLREVSWRLRRSVRNRIRYLHIHLSQPAISHHWYTSCTYTDSLLRRWLYSHDVSELCWSGLKIPSKLFF